MTSPPTPLSTARRIVLKVGSSLLVDPASGTPHAARFEALSADVASLRADGKSVIIVSSGAVALGRRALGLKTGHLKLEEKQAAAAAGQPRLMRAWEDALARHNAPVAQALLTFDDTERRRRWLNARATLETLLERGAVPIVNENDTVATEEIRYGDNDRLAARVAQMMGADVLVLLSDIDGLYDADPRSNPNARHIPEVRRLTPEILAMAGGANPSAGVGSGGMATKLEAARIAMTAGCATVITLGDQTAPGPVSALAAGARATWFLPDITPETARRQWLSGALKPAGALTIDAGAVRALRAGKSLLPAGVTHVTGRFERGDAVDVLDSEGRSVARGVSAYSSEDAVKLIGRNSADIEAILGFRGRPAIIHVDDMALSSRPPSAPSV
ncbi:MAG: glutamate 5-kinase [Alphaproteobacteria bacterium]|nr:glutamate 5-kinase [Alphaproteobacteria bacterium]